MDHVQSSVVNEHGYRWFKLISSRKSQLTIRLLLSNCLVTFARLLGESLTVFAFSARWMMNEWTDTSLRYSTATGEYVSNDFFRHSLDDNPASYLTQVPILEYRWIVSFSQPSLRTQFKVATVYSIRTQSLSWCSTGLVPNVLPRRDEGSGKPCSIDRAS